MKRILIVGFALMILTLTLTAQDQGIGVGLNTGGLSVKYWMSSSNAAAVQWNFGSTLTADYLFDKPDMLKLLDETTPVYYGAGLLLGSHTELDDDLEETTKLDLGVRGVIGLGYYLSSFPVDLYIQSSPTLKLLGGGGFSFGGTLGIRYFF